MLVGKWFILEVLICNLREGIRVMSSLSRTCSAPVAPFVRKLSFSRCKAAVLSSCYLSAHNSKVSKLTPVFWFIDSKNSWLLLRSDLEKSLAVQNIDEDLWNKLGLTAENEITQALTFGDIHTFLKNRMKPRDLFLKYVPRYERMIKEILCMYAPPRLNDPAFLPDEYKITILPLQKVQLFLALEVFAKRYCYDVTCSKLASRFSSNEIVVREITEFILTTTERSR